MRNKRNLNFAIGLIALLAFGTIALAIYINSIAETGTPIVAQPAASARTAIAASLPTTRQSTAIPATIPVTRPVVIETPAIILAIPASPAITPAVTTLPPTGEAAINQPKPQAYSQRLLSLGIKVVPAVGPPIISQETALKVLFSRLNPKDSFIISDSQVVINGTVIPFRATYGLVTVGGPGPNGGWAGSFLNAPLSNCTLDGKCTPTGEVLDHIENRPMWLIDLEITVPVGGQTCPPASTPCSRPPDPNHQVDLLDAQTLSLFGGASYYQP